MLSRNNTSSSSSSTTVDNWTYTTDCCSRENYYDYTWFEQLIGVAVPTLFGVIVLVGFIGNLVVVLVVSLYRRARTATSLLMLNLAVADLVFIVVCVPTTAARYALPVWPLGSAWCKIYQYTRTVTAYGSVYTLVLMALDRYLAIVHPVGSIDWRTVRKTAAVMAITWVIVCCGNCPEWYRVTEYTFENQTRSDCINAFVYGFNDSVVIQHNRRVYYSMFFVIGYAVPLTVICVFYVLLVRRIGGRVGGNSNEVGGTSLKAAATRRRVMRMVTAVIVTFAVCWLPTHVAFLVEAFATINEYYRVEMVAFQIAATCLAYANSCLNPVIYAFLSESFRQSFRELLFVGGNRGDQSQMSRALRRRSGDGKHKPDGRSSVAMSGNVAIPMSCIKVSAPIPEPSRIGTTLSVAP